ncbi:hypothetical protein [Flavobacterium sp. UBA4197]|uniref:hypothetical protein n=1 Tax=Flavobacterium sp. UBA4197 TaxID=1946546 RepID=UPI00257D39DD|nr:hypothetical protein [Flavobacterium sp. UBA4197]
MPFTLSNDNEGFSTENPKIKVWKFPNSIPNSPTTSGFFNRLPQFPENRKNNPCGQIRSSIRKDNSIRLSTKKAV